MGGQVGLRERGGGEGEADLWEEAGVRVGGRGGLAGWVGGREGGREEAGVREEAGA